MHGTYITNKIDPFYIINPLNLDTGYRYCNSLQEDAYERICSGKENTDTAALYCYNPSLDSIEKKLNFSSNSNDPQRLKISPDRTQLYFIDNDMYRISVNSNNLPSSPFITSNGRNLYGLGIDPENGDIYLSDAIDYVQKGMIYRYDATAQEISQFRAGIIPNDFYFK